MAMQELQGRLRHEGGVRNRAAAVFLGGIRRTFGDVPVMPEASPAELIQFPAHTKLELVKEGKLVVPLRGQTIRSYLDAQRPINPEVRSRFEGTEILDMPALRAEVAIDPLTLFTEEGRMPNFTVQLNGAPRAYAHGTNNVELKLK